MSWFSDQIRQRKKQDNETFSDAFAECANAVLGRSFSFASTEGEDALRRILNHFGVKNVTFPDKSDDMSLRLEYVSRITGILYRSVELRGKWYKDACGAFMANRRDTGETVALLPHGYRSYRYYDPATRHYESVNKKTAERFEIEALCFYKPFPVGQITFRDLMKFAISVCSVYDIVGMAAGLAMSTLLGLLLPRLNFFLFDQVIGTDSVTLLLSTIVFMATITVAQLLFMGVTKLFDMRIQASVIKTIEAAAMMRTLSLPPDFFRRYSTAEIVQRMEYIPSLCASIVCLLFGYGFTGLFSLAYITQIHAYAPALTLPALGIILAQGLFFVCSTLRQKKTEQLRLSLAAQNSSRALSIITGMEKIRLTGAEKRAFSQWAEGFARETKVQYNPPLSRKLNVPITMFLSLAGQFLLYWIAMRRSVGAAEYYAFQTAYASVSAAVNTLGIVALAGATLTPRYEMARPILEAVPETAGRSQPVTRLSGAIELNRVTFRYAEDMPNVIDNFSLKIRPGQYVAIVGKTGCGKSTLIRLLLGFETPQKGAIYYDGRDLSTLDKPSVRRLIGAVMQDDQLFVGDIYSNLTVCAPKLGLKEVWEAAEAAGIADDIRAMPMGMQTMISEGGGGISGGQRQRLVIARAIAPKPSILIFDEATSALDNVTQKQVSDALDKLKCTRIVIAHRLSTIRYCDRILVMDKGHIIEDGTYEEPIEKGGYFADLVERQRIDVTAGS